MRQSGRRIAADLMGASSEFLDARRTGRSSRQTRRRGGPLAGLDVRRSSRHDDDARPRGVRWLPWQVFKRGSVVIFLDFLRENRPVTRPSRPVTAGPPSLRVPPPVFGASPRGPRVRAPSAGCLSPATRYRVSLGPASFTL